MSHPQLEHVALNELPVAVVDFETTGLNAAVDRVVEVAVAHFSGFDPPQVVFSSLVNPDRPIDPRAQAVHGISDAAVAAAPFFGDVAGHLLDCLRGRLISAYNAPFDMRFLLTELHRLGYHDPLWAVCTMELGQVIFARPRRRLETACHEAGLTLDAAHRAASDALATARLLQRYLARLWDEGYQTLAAFRSACGRSLLRAYGQGPRPVTTSVPRSQTPDAAAWDRLKETCEKLNHELQTKFKTLESILRDGLASAAPIDWDRWTIPLEFPAPPPEPPKLQRPTPPPPELRPHPEQRPNPKAPRYQVVPDIVDSFLPWRLEQKRRSAREAYRRDVEAYKEKVEAWNALIRQYRQAARAAQEQYRRELAAYRQALAEHQERERAHRARALRHNAQIAREREGFRQGEPTHVAGAITRALSSSNLPEEFPTSVSVTYDPGKQTLEVIRILPQPDVVPRIKSYRAVKKDMAYKEVPLSATEHRRRYDDIVYQLMLRTVHNIFVADVEQHICSVVLRGAVEGYDPATGQPGLLVIARLEVAREDYQRLRLEKVDPAECFKALGGKARGRPSNLRPIETIHDE